MPGAGIPSVYFNVDPGGERAEISEESETSLDVVRRKEVRRPSFLYMVKGPNDGKKVERFRDCFGKESHRPASVLIAFNVSVISPSV